MAFFGGGLDGRMHAHADTYLVRLASAGLRNGDAMPDDEATLRSAIHGVLHGLAKLHEVCVCARARARALAFLRARIIHAPNDSCHSFAHSMPAR